MSKPRRRKQKKQVKAELKLRQFAATELSDQLAALPCAADLRALWSTRSPAPMRPPMPSL